METKSDNSEGERRVFIRELVDAGVVKIIKLFYYIFCDINVTAYLKSKARESNVTTSCYGGEGCEINSTHQADSPSLGTAYRPIRQSRRSELR